jgi:hypothetical protein
MAKFIIEFTEEAWYRLEVEASSREEALDNFWGCEYEYSRANQFGGEIQQDITIIERKVVA